MFKTARFKVHNPSRHKRTMLWYALTNYHLTLKRVLEAALAQPDLLDQISIIDKRGNQRVKKSAIGRLLYRLAPKGWALAPLRDYLIGDAAAMLLSHFKKLEKGKHQSNPPSLPGLSAFTDEEYGRAYEVFTRSERFPVKPIQQEKIDKAAAEGKVRVAERLTHIYEGWAASRAAGDILRRLEGVLPRPIEFARPEMERGFALVRRGNDFFLLIRLFAAHHRYAEAKVLAPGFVDCRTGEVLDGKRFSGIILPLELGRDYHENEYLQHGRPQSAKLLARKNDAGQIQFYLHVAFEFVVEALQPETVLGIDRGAAKIGAGSLVSMDGQTLRSGIDLEGAAFSQAMKRLRCLIASRQRRGLRTGRVMRLRGRRSEIVIGEYANRIIAAALEHKSQIAIEKINATSMARFLTQSQFTKLRDSLAYKAERVGLPVPIEVPAAYTSQTCARCGHKAPENRLKQEVFLCVQCGYAASADQNASEIIALRGLHQLKEGGKFQKFDAFQVWMRSLGRDRFCGESRRLVVSAALVLGSVANDDGFVRHVSDPLLV